MFGVNPISLKVVMSVGVDSIIANAPVAVLRSILNPVSLVALSIQDNLILVVETTIPVKLDGASGAILIIGGVLLESVFVEQPKIKRTTKININLGVFISRYRINFNFFRGVIEVFWLILVVLTPF